MVTVKYFANLRALAKKDEEQFTLNGDMPLSQFCDIIGKTQPQIGEMMRQKKIMVAVNFDVAPLDFIIRDGDELGLLPPFSGGS